MLKVNKFSNIIVYLCESQVYRQILSLDIDSNEQGGSYQKISPSSRTDTTVTARVAWSDTDLETCNNIKQKYNWN